MNYIKIFKFLKSLPNKINSFYKKNSNKKVIITNKSLNKKDFNPVTNFDKKFERYFRSLILKKFPKDGISGEEFKEKISRNKFEWIIDPIDGTKIFVVGGPTWSNLIGLTYEKKSVAGLANFPELNKFYINNQKKSFLFEKKIIKKLKTSKIYNVKKAKIIGSFHGSSRFKIEKKINKKLGFKLNLTKLDALSFCLLAEGKIDAILESNLKSYDIVPLIPIIKNAGGLITNWKNKPAEEGGNILASANKKIHKKLIKLLKDI